MRGKLFASKGMWCAFGAIRNISAAVVSSSLILCAAPPSAQAIQGNQTSVTVQVSANGVDYSRSSLEYAYVEGLRVFGVTPNVGRSNEVLRVTGANFVSTGSVQCKLGKDSVFGAEYRSSTQVACRIFG